MRHRRTLEDRVEALEAIHIGHSHGDLNAVIGKLDEIKQLLAERTSEMSADLDGIRTDVGIIKQNEAAQAAAIQALVERLGNNPTAEEIAAIRTELQGVIDNQGANTAAINSLDPDVPGGSVTPE